MKTSIVKGRSGTSGLLGLLLLVFACCPASLNGQDVSSVGNSASYFTSSLPGYGIARGSLMVLFGWGIGPEQLVQQSGFPLPLELGGTSIKVTVKGVTQSAPLFYTSYRQVAALLPSSVPAGEGTLTLTYKGRAAWRVDIKVVESAFGIYSIASSGMGAAVITTTDYQVKTLADSFRPNDVLVLWGTGLGAVSGDEAAGPAPGNYFPEAEVYVGSERAKVQYAGRSGCCAGLDQINFEVPAGVQGCSVPVAVRNGGVTSNFVTMPVAPGGGPCSERVGIPSDLLRAAQSGGPIRVGAVALGPLPVLQASGFSYSRAITERVSAALKMKVTEKQIVELLRASGSERRKAAAELVRRSSRSARDRIARLWALSHLASGFDQQGSSAVFGQLASLGAAVVQLGEVFPPPGSCMVYPEAIINSGHWTLQTARYDAGPELLLSSPLGSRSLRPTKKGVYQISFGGGFAASQLPAGTYSLSSVGGADVGSFTASVVLTGDLRWTNKGAAAVVDRGVPLNVTWSGGAAAGYILFGGSATSDVTGVNRLFACVEDIRAGRFTVPSYVLGALPPAKTDKAYLFLGAHPLQNRFSATGLDVGFIADLNTDYQEVEFR